QDAMLKAILQQLSCRPEPALHSAVFALDFLAEPQGISDKQPAASHQQLQELQEQITAKPTTPRARISTDLHQRSEKRTFTGSSAFSKRSFSSASRSRSFAGSDRGKSFAEKKGGGSKFFSDVFVGAVKQKPRHLSISSVDQFRRKNAHARASERTQGIDQSETTEDTSLRPRETLGWLLERLIFDISIFIVILMSVISVGIEADMTAQRPLDDIPLIFEALNLFYTVVFAIEIALKWGAGDSLPVDFQEPSAFKVKGHAEYFDLEVGDVSYADYIGNWNADQLAVTGAASHSLSRDMIDEFYLQVCVFACRQVILAMVIQERWEIIRGRPDGPAEQLLDEGEAVTAAEPTAAAFGGQPVPAQAPSVSLDGLTNEQALPVVKRIVLAYTWDVPAVGDFVNLGSEPISQRSAWGSSWGWDARLRPATRWYLGQLKWSNTGVVSYFDFLVDFIAATGMLPANRDAKQSTRLVNLLLTIWTNALRATAVYWNVPEVLGDEMCFVSHLVPFGVQKQIRGRTWRPQFLCPNSVHMVLVHCFRNVDTTMRFAWDLPALADVPVYVASPYNVVWTTIGNQARRAVGLAPDGSTHAADCKRSDLLVKHNESVGTSGLHTIEFPQPSPAGVMDRQQFHHWWQRGVAIVCDTRPSSFDIARPEYAWLMDRER
ncbi:unnamed protein product, partial [Polarella glacialis]